MPDPPLLSFPCTPEVRMTRTVCPTALTRQLGGPNPLEYALVFLVVVAGVLALVR
jgi:hypothetical protein